MFHTFLHTILKKNNCPVYRIKSKVRGFNKAYFNLFLKNIFASETINVFERQNVDIIWPLFGVRPFMSIKRSVLFAHTFPEFLLVSKSQWNPCISGACRLNVRGIGQAFKNP